MALSSTLSRRAPIAGGRITRACSMPGRVKSWTYTCTPAHFAGTSGRGSDCPTSAYVAGSARGAFGSSFSSKERTRISSASAMPLPPAFGAHLAAQRSARSSGGRPSRSAAAPKQGLACGCGGLPDLHAAAHHAAAPGRGPLIRREVGVALDQVDPIDADAELLGRHLPHGDAQPLAEIDFAAEHGHRAVRVDGKKAVHRRRIRPRLRHALSERSGRSVQEAEPDHHGAFEEGASRHPMRGHVSARSRFGRPKHRTHNPHMRAATAQIAIERRSDFHLRSGGRPR